MANIYATSCQPDNSILVYPNPAKGLVNVSFSGNQVSANYNLTDATGRTLISGSFDKPNNQINIQQQGTGIYILHIYAGGKESIQKIIKE